MKELSLHILDIVQNSIKADAKLIKITISEDNKADLLSIKIEDDGKGMSEEVLSRVEDPFYTTRTTRSVGLGIPLFESAAKACGGDLKINSTLGKGTSVYATFKLNHIDRAPIGDMAGTFAMLASGNPNIDFVYSHFVDSKSFTIDTRELKKILKEVSIDSIEVMDWIKDYTSQSLKILSGGYYL